MALDPFAQRPRASLVLALALVTIGVVFAAGLVPTSPNHVYFPGHEWVMAALAWGLAAFVVWRSRR
jgi:hypothetical protein